MSLAKRFIQARITKGISQEDLAGSVGCAQSIISKIESGKVERTRFLADFARELDVTADWLGENKVAETRASYSAQPTTSRGASLLNRLSMAFESGSLTEHDLLLLEHIANHLTERSEGK